MAGFSLGKLDTICARLKSSQKPLTTISSSTKEDAKSQIKTALFDLGLCSQDGKKSHKDVIVETNEADINLKDSLSVNLLERQAFMDKQRIGDVFEKVKAQSASGDDITEHKVGDYSIIKKYDNYNAKEAANFNNEIASSAQPTTFQTADSTTSTADSCVSSTTAESVLCNKNIHLSQTIAIPVPSSILIPHSSLLSTIRSERDKSFHLCSVPPALSGSLLAQNLTCVSYSEKSPCTDMSDIMHNDIKDSDVKVCAAEYQSVSTVTLTQGNPIGASGSVCETQLVHKDVESDCLPSSPLLPSVLPYAEQPSVFSSMFPSCEVAPEVLPKSRNKLSTFGITFKDIDVKRCVLHKNKKNSMSVRDYTSPKSEHRASTEDFTDLQDASNNLLAEDDKQAEFIHVSSVDQCSTYNLMPMSSKETQVPFTNIQSSQNSASPASVISSGRRKSRKPVKSQKQITNWVYTDHILGQEINFISPSIAETNERNGGIEMRGSESPEETIKLTRLPGSVFGGDHNEGSIMKHCLSPPDLSSPLDLSRRNSSSQLKELSFSNNQHERTFTTMSSGVNYTSNDSSGAELRLGTRDASVRTAASAEKPCSQLGSADEMHSARSRALETAESKFLEDFAKNTMKELLGIYGFEGPDSRNINLKSIDSFTDDKLIHFPAVSDDKSSTISLATTEGGERISESNTTLKNKSAKASQKNISGASAGPSTEPGQKSPPDKARVTPHAKAAKNSISKNSLTQKVLSSVDFNKYIRRYGSGSDCGEKVCQDLSYRDHYHCRECSQKVFIRKDEMVRHCKWHKKRNDSLQHGFMRYSPLDDCGKKHGNCIHNFRQTHYHCVQKGCDKVYVSTSDVQMHGNFHRKDSAIIQEGFQRFRATEDCGTPSCSFYGLRTTHFHCRRPHCNFTFKNKADMDKHKSYHQKDEILSRDGFKKFMKYDTCPYTDCQYSNISNHIHCIRPGCVFVLHSTAQLYSHKRKHERHEFEHVYHNLQHLQQQQKLSNGSAVNTKMAVLNGVKSFSVTQAASRQTKFLHIPASVINNEIMNLQVSSIPSDKLMSNVTTKAVPVQGFAVTGPVEFSKKAPGFSPLKLGHQTSDEVLENSDLNEKEKVKETRNVSEELKQTLALPIKSFSVNAHTSHADVKLEQRNEVDNVGEIDFKEEPEDLSMPAKAKQENAHIKDQDLNEDLCLKLESNSVSLQQMSEILDYGGDDDDDSDDDDMDYGQLEEPTLVNPFCSGLEEDELNNLLTLPMPKQSSEVSREDHLNNEVNSSLTAALEPDSSDTNADIVKGSSMVLEFAENVNSQQNQLDDCHLPQTQLSQEAPEAVLTSMGKVLGIRIPQRMTHERQEEDELWQKYLIRYTANDACSSRCACLYKDHYHCQKEGCEVVFKSKDGVRSHARCHELQDHITPLVYFFNESRVSCDLVGCHFSGKEGHYHCNWDNCTHVIPESAPTFSRLEHYRIHEYTTTPLGKHLNGISPAGCRVEPNPLQKRRGRPPKNPKYDLPLVPKVHLTEKEILDSTLAFMHNKSSENSRVINGFKKFLSTEMCPDDLCLYKGKDHFHCGRKYCHMSTDRMNFLNLHAQDFHNNVTILVGYEFFERMVDCRRPNCQNKKVNRHFHCIRPRCDYSFIRHSTMTHHSKKHPTVTSTVLSAPVTRSISTQSKTTPSQFVPIAPAVTTPSSATITPSACPTAVSSANFIKTVKSSGTYFPLSGASSFKLSSLTTQNLASGGKGPVLSSSPLTPGGKGPVLPSSPLTSGSTTLSQVITVGHISHSQESLPVFSSTAFLTIPNSTVAGSIPVITQTSQGQQTSLLAGIIPVGQLSHHGLASPLVCIAASQLIAASQGHVLQQNETLRGTGVVQVIENQTAISTHPMTTPATIDTLTTLPASTIPVTGLLQQHQQLQQQNDVACSLNWASLKKQMQYSVAQNCGRPFCKLKKKGHYHCLECNQAFSDPARLRLHIGKHGFKFKKSKLRASQSITTEPLSKNASSSEPVDLSLEAKTKGDSGESNAGCVYEESLSSSLNLQPSTFANILRLADSPVTKTTPTCYVNGSSKSVVTKLLFNQFPAPSMGCGQKPISENEDQGHEDLSKSQISIGSDCNHGTCSDSLPAVLSDSLHGSDELSHDVLSSGVTLPSSLSRKSGRKRTAAKNDFASTTAETTHTPAKQRKTWSRVKGETNLPEGYKRVRCGEDCGHVRCAYRQTVTHFHCLRTDCGYGFSDKSRILQHHTRHERLDALMRGEFQQFRASVTCDRADCEFDEKASHFHCLKCTYSCADSSKVPAHRKYHSKLDIISSQGFIKYAGTAVCQTAACSYFRKQTHYHCTFPGCNHAVLAPSQMSLHKLKHT